jgi:hypothetical protein
MTKVLQTTPQNLLFVLDEVGTKATSFASVVAEKHAKIIKEIEKAAHEIGSWQGRLYDK